MTKTTDKSLLERLQALRGASEPPESISSKINIDPIERSKTPTREDTLAARLKSLRSREPSPQAKPTPPHQPQQHRTLNKQSSNTRGKTPAIQSIEDDDFEKLLQTDDQTLDELLRDVEGDESFAVGAEPDDEKVKALLEELAESIPKDQDENSGWRDKAAGGGGDDSDDDSDGEKMKGQVDDVIAKLKDEAELDAAIDKDRDGAQDAKREGEGPAADDTTKTNAAEVTLPDVPDDLAATTTPTSNSDIRSLTDRLAALRTPSSTDPADILPSVPTSAPMKEPKRLVSTTNYTDEDVESWCTVCLEDATLRCIGCDNDPYCHRCWTEMHVGPRAGYDERNHRAVQFNKGNKEERVAVGAS